MSNYTGPITKRSASWVLEHWCDVCRDFRVFTGHSEIEGIARRVSTAGKAYTTLEYYSGGRQGIDDDTLLTLIPR